MEGNKGKHNAVAFPQKRGNNMKATTITVKKTDYGRIFISTRNGDYTVDEETAVALEALIDDCDWQEA